MGGITRYIQLLGRAMTGRGHQIWVASGGGTLEGEFERGGLKTARFSVRKKSILDPSLYAALPGLNDLVCRERFDLIHSHTRVTHALAYFLSRITGVPTVNTFHGYFKYNLGRKILPFWGNRIVAISLPVAEELMAIHRAPASCVRVVNNAIDLESSAQKLSALVPHEIRIKYHIPADATVLCYIARLVQDKGHEILLRAVAQLLPEFPDLFLFLVGDGKEKEALEKTVDQLKLRSRVVRVPHISDISEALCVTDIFVHPAFYREGFGLAIAEAMAAGRPVVITNIPAINRIFRPGECCVLAEPADIGSLAGAIRFLIEAPGEKKRIAEAGKKLVNELCSLERQAGEMETVYRELAPS